MILRILTTFSIIFVLIWGITWLVAKALALRKPIEPTPAPSPPKHPEQELTVYLPKPSLKARTTTKPKSTAAK